MVGELLLCCLGILWFIIFVWCVVNIGNSFWNVCGS